MHRSARDKKVAVMAAIFSSSIPLGNIVTMGNPSTVTIDAYIISGYFNNLCKTFSKLLVLSSIIAKKSLYLLPHRYLTSPNIMFSFYR